MSALTKRAVAPEDVKGKRVDLKWLTPAELEIEPLAQRSFDAKWAEDLAREWDDDKLGVLEVSQRDGRYFVTDGQHRRAALITNGLGNVPVPCNVFFHDDVAGQAKRYVADNVEKRRPNPVDSFRIKVAAKDPESVAIQRVIEDNGLIFYFGSGSNYISCVSAVQWVYRRGGAKLLDNVLKLINSTWSGERSSRDGNIVKAIALLLDKVGNQLDLDSFAHKVQSDSTAARIMGTARAHKMATGKALYIQAAEVLVSVYNKGRTTKRVTL